MPKSRKVIITCAVTGSIHTPSMSQHLPVTASEIADAAIGAAAAGAAIVHLHARDPKTGKPDPAKMKAFFAANPETKPFQDWVKAHPASSGLGNSAYYSINAFRFVDASGHEHAVRWSVEPETAYAPVDPQEKSDPNFLSTQLAEQLAHGDVRWHLIVTLADAGDPTNDATLQWPAGRQRCG